MLVAKTLALFVITALAEIIGCYLPWLWLKKGAPGWVLLPAAGSLMLFAWLLTLHPAASGRIYAAYGGVYVATALVWLHVVDVLPGVFEGGTTTNAFFVMRHIGPPRRADWETASVRWVDFDAAEKLIARTTNAIGRARDLAILKAARAWFDANLTVVLPDDEDVPIPASRADSCG